MTRRSPWLEADEAAFFASNGSVMDEQMFQAQAAFGVAGGPDRLELTDKGLEFAFNAASCYRLDLKLEHIHALTVIAGAGAEGLIREALPRNLEPAARALTHARINMDDQARLVAALNGDEDQYRDLREHSQLLWLDQRPGEPDRWRVTTLGQSLLDSGMCIRAQLIAGRTAVLQIRQTAECNISPQVPEFDGLRTQWAQHIVADIQAQYAIYRTLASMRADAFAQMLGNYSGDPLQFHDWLLWRHLDLSRLPEPAPALPKSADLSTEAMNWLADLIQLSPVIGPAAARMAFQVMPSAIRDNYIPKHHYQRTCRELFDRVLAQCVARISETTGGECVCCPSFDAAQQHAAFARGAQVINANDCAVHFVMDPEILTAVLVSSTPQQFSDSGRRVSPPTRTASMEITNSPGF